MHSIKELEDTLNWSYDQIRNRIVQLSNEIEGVTERGKNNKIFITQKGLGLLRKLKDLEDQGKSVQNGVETIMADLDNHHEEKNTNTTKSDKPNSYPEQIELLQDQIRELREDKKYLRQKLDEKERQIQQLLPAAKKERENPLNRLFAWISG